MSTAAILATPSLSTPTPTYLVRLTGILPGLKPLDVAAQLAPFFDRSPEQLAPALTGINVVVKRGLDENRAQRYVATLRDAGCICDVETEGKRKRKAKLAAVPVTEAAPQPAQPAAAAPVLALADDPATQSSAVGAPITLKKRAVPTKVAEDPAMQRWLALNPPALPHASRGPLRPSEPVEEESDSTELEEGHDPSVALMAIGQTLCIDAILLNALARGVDKHVSLAGSLVIMVVLAALSVFGLTRMARGLGLGKGARILTAIGGLVPFVSVVVMVVMSAKVSRRIKDAGYSVGLLGVSSDDREAMGGDTPEEPYSRKPSLIALALVLLIAAFTI